MSRTYNTIRYNALERKALAHDYPDAETYLHHARGSKDSPTMISTPR